MKFFKPKIIIEKRYKYLKIDKKANFQKILLNIISLIIFLIILKNNLVFLRRVKFKVKITKA